MKQTGNKKVYNGSYNKLGKKPNFKKPYKKKEEDEKFDIEKWIKQHSNIEYPKRGKKNSLGEYKKNKRRH